jgi:hypothetical protein
MTVLLTIYLTGAVVFGLTVLCTDSLPDGWAENAVLVLAWPLTLGALATMAIHDRCRGRRGAVGGPDRPFGPAAPDTDRA